MWKYKTIISRIKGGNNIDKKKKTIKIILLILLVLLVITGLSLSYAWVIDSQKSKIESTEILVSETDELLISTDDSTNKNYTTTIDLTSTILNTELKDFSGDGINLCSAIIDPYTKAPKATGWSYAKTNASLTEEELKKINDKNQYSYYSFNIYFQSAVKLNVYLHRDSYVLPNDANMHNSDHTNTYCLYLKRTMYYNTSTLAKTYTYEDENGILKYKISESEKTTYEASTDFPHVYNRSLYSQEEFYDDNDSLAILNGETTYSQVIYSVNYVSSGIRVAFINEDDDHTVDYDTLTYSIDSNTNLRVYSSTQSIDNVYNKTKLRLLWAPNPGYVLTKTYNSGTDSTTYEFNITNHIEHYYDNDTDTKTELGYSVTYSNGNKYYYSLNNGTESLLMYVTEDGAYKKIDGTSITDSNDTNYLAYKNLISSTGYTTDNDSEIDSYRNNNQFYRYNGTSAALTNVPDQLFSNTITTTTSNIGTSQILTTLTKETGSNMYTGKITVVIWLEGNDSDTSLAFASGNGDGCLENSGIAKLKYRLSFFGEMVEDTSSNE